MNARLRLQAPTRDEVMRAREWRNGDSLDTLRTPFRLTEEMQGDFYRDVISNRSSPHRFFSMYSGDGVFTAFGGLTNIQWENGLAEISLIVHPEYRGKGIGRASVDVLLAEAFDRMRLMTVCGEVYKCNTTAAAFWTDLAAAGDWTMLELPRRKWAEGRLWDSLYFSVSIEQARAAARRQVDPT